MLTMGSKLTLINNVQELAKQQKGKAAQRDQMVIQLLIQQTVYKQVSTSQPLLCTIIKCRHWGLGVRFCPRYLNVQTWILAYSNMKIHIKEIHREDEDNPQSEKVQLCVLGMGHCSLKVTVHHVQNALRHLCYKSSWDENIHQEKYVVHILFSIFSLSLQVFSDSISEKIWLVEEICKHMC